MYKSYKIQILLVVFSLVFLISPQKMIFAQSSGITEKLSGKILLQVESLGEAWYVNPGNNKRYFLGKPLDVFNIMRELGLGITNSNLEKIPIGIINYNDADDDNDGATNRFEISLGTNPGNADTDNDGYDDLTEIEKNYNPLGLGKQLINLDFAKKNQGKIFLQIEKNGEAWYVNPNDNKRYFLGRPADAFDLIKKMGLGISNSNLEKIAIAYFPSAQTPSETKNTPAIPNQAIPRPMSAYTAITGAASAIRSQDALAATYYFIPEMKEVVKFNMDNMSNESIFDLASILSSAKLTKSSDNEEIYSNDIYFPLGNQDVHLDFIIKKQSDGSWLMTNL
jgi:hypothetical protein